MICFRLSLICKTRLLACIKDVLRPNHRTLTTACLHVSSQSLSSAICISSFTAYVYPHIQVPFFILNSFYDAFQLECIMTANSTTGACEADPSWKPCFASPEACTPAQVT